jgi:hypothetical protein
MTMLSRWIRISAVFVLAAACADARLPAAPTSAAEPAAGTRSPAPAESAAPVAHVVCEKDSLTLENPVVRAQRDGVHVAVENRGGVWGFEFRHLTDPNIAWNGGPIGRGTTRLTDAHGPGEVLVACLRARDPDPQGDYYRDENAPTAKLTIVDPDDLYVPWELACGFGEQFRRKMAAGEDESPLSVARRVPGVMPTDSIKRPKYPGSPRYSPMEFIVFRDGQAIARLMGPHDRYDQAWHLLINACPGSGITKA